MAIHYSVSFNIKNVYLCSYGDASENEIDALLRYLKERGVEFSTHRGTGKRVEYFSEMESKKYAFAVQFFSSLSDVLKQARKDGYDQLIALTQGIKDGVALTSMYFLATIGQAASAWEEAKANRPIETSDPAKSLPIVTCERDPKLLELT